MKTPPIHPVLSGGTFGLMSGEKPFFPAQIEANHENLVKTLTSMGLKHEQTHGRYGDPERSVIIHNPREDQMKTLGKLFGQESVIHSSGGKHRLIYTNGPDEGKFRGTVPAQVPHEWFENPPEDYYTHLPGNGHFRINFDFDQEPQGANANVKPGMAKSDLMPGGKGDDKTDSSFDDEQLRTGIRTEMREHGLDAARAKEIAKDHLTENPKYYSVKKSIFQRLNLKKALPAGASLKPPMDSPANRDNRTAFPGSKEHAVATDALGGAEVRGVQPTLAPVVAQIDKNKGYLGRVWGAADFNNKADAARGWTNDNPAAEPAGSWNPTDAEFNPRDVMDRTQDKNFWAHPNFYEWHDGHTDHHNPRPWDKKTAMDTARGLGLIKADVLNDQNATAGVSTYAKFAAPYGQITPGTRSNLAHYDYNNKLPAVQDLVKKHGFQVYYAGGKYGKPDLANKNYNTNHLMIYDPGSHNDAQQGEVDYTNAWRQIHELAHALTYPELNRTYGEGRRIGKLGTHRTLNEAQRAVHWEHLAAHKQRELSKQIGVHIPDDVFNKEYNTVMHDAVHRAVTGQFTEPASEGFTPHSHQVPLSHALDMVRHEGKKMGLQHQHDLAPKRQ